MPGSRATDSHGVSWGGRELGPTGFENDSGAADPALRSLLAEGGQDERLMAALAAARFLVPVVAAPTELGEHDGLAVDSRVELATVTLESPDGERALPVFTGVDALASWNAEARPVPVSAARVGQAAVAERCDVVVVDVAGPATRVLRPSMVWALAQQRPWLPAHEDPFVLRAVAAACADEPALTRHTLGDGSPAGTGRLAVTLHLTPGLQAEEVRALATRVGERLASDGELRARVDGLSFRVV